VHALLVRDIEVPDGASPAVQDLERQALRTGALAILAAVQGKPVAGLRYGKSRHRRVRALRSFRVVRSVLGQTRV